MNPMLLQTWGLPLLLALGGLLAGGLASAVWGWRRCAAGPTAAPGTAPGTGTGTGTAPVGDSDDSLEDVEAQLNHALAQLVDLKQQQGRLQASAYAADLAATQARAAQLLRRSEQLRQARPAGPAPAAPAAGLLAGRPFARGYLWGAGTVGLLGSLSLGVLQAQVPVPAAAPPADARPAAAVLPPTQMDDATQAELQALMAGLQKNPTDAAKTLRLAHLLLRVQMLHEAKIVNDRALRLLPDSPEAQVHAAVLLAAEGDTAAANGQLDALVQAHGGLAEGWFFRGMLAMQVGNHGRMLQSFRRYLAVAEAGSQRDRIAKIVADAGP